MDYPFDTFSVSYAYVTANSANGYSHLTLTMCLPELARSYSESSVILCITSQAGGDVSRTELAPEPFYAIRFGAQPQGSSESMSADMCERAAKALRRIQKGIEKIDLIAGSSASLIEDMMVRTINAAKITHVYVSPEVNSHLCIPDMRHHELPGSLFMRDNIVFLKRRALEACGVIAKVVS
ncbi:MAG: hypothetical protein ACSLE8_06135 [Rhodococcus sp. (in: high G+C Gram-positive bacteria)]